MPNVSGAIVDAGGNIVGILVDESNPGDFQFNASGITPPTASQPDLRVVCIKDGSAIGTIYSTDVGDSSLNVAQRLAGVTAAATYTGGQPLGRLAFPNFFTVDSNNTIVQG